MVKQESVFVVRGHSESGDHYVSVFRKKPTKKQLSKLAHDWDGSPDKDGPGEDGSYVHLEVDQEEFQD